MNGFDSLVAFRNSQGVEGRGTLLHVTRSLVVFEVYNPYSIVQLSEVLRDVRILRGERTIYNGRAVVSNLVATGIMYLVSATLVDTWTDLDGLAPGAGLRQEVESFVLDWQKSYVLRPTYQLAVGNIRSFLGELSRWLDQTELLTGPDRSDAAALHREFLEEVQSPLVPVVDQLFARFEEEADRVSPEEVQPHRSFVQRELHPLLLCAPSSIAFSSSPSDTLATMKWST